MKIRDAFTMIELVFVVLIIGILASLAIPRLDRDVRQEAIDNLINAFRYTQQLALIDDKTDPLNPDWQKKYWHIRFTTSSDYRGNFYIICSDENTNGYISKSECAVDPNTGKYYYNSNGDLKADDDESPTIFLGKKYGIKSITFDSNCQSNASSASHHIAFDRYGRPHIGVASASNDFSTYLKSDCKITFEFVNPEIESINIVIAKQTGSVSVQE